MGPSKTTVQNQAPLVAKVLTNAAGQVISVESLLAHQKQHGTLPQGEYFLLLITDVPDKLLNMGKRYEVGYMKQKLPPSLNILF